ncbi:hypothetical protein BS78_01G271000 [Paspalum vaginatum]|nr:hypothetical protein BS78_01G271000 [Paspalum vaginatum]
MPPHAPPPWRSPRPACTPYAHPPSAPPASPPAAPPPPRRTHRIRSSPSAPPTPRWWPCRRRRHAPRRRRRRHARGAGRDRRTRGRPGAAPQASGTRRLRRLCVHSFRRRLLCHRGACVPAACLRGDSVWGSIVFPDSIEFKSRCSLLLRC